jgi:tetratricopeptide (TPR) repeat protein
MQTLDSFRAVAVVLLLSLLVVWLATSLAFNRGWWRLSRVLGRLSPYVFGSNYGSALSFHGEAFALREQGRLAEAVALARARLAGDNVPAIIRNLAIDILISAGAYREALGAEQPPQLPGNAREALGLALIQINLAEAEYNLGRWDAAEARLRPLDLGCWVFPLSRAGLLQQRAWIAAHRGRAGEALELCARVSPRWLPMVYQAEYHFTRAVALLGERRSDEADVAMTKAERLARRHSTRRNALFLRARMAAARGDWPIAESLCRRAADHAFRGQGGAGLLLWAEALRQLGRQVESTEALRLVIQRDPESESAGIAGQLLERGA